MCRLEGVQRETVIFLNTVLLQKPIFAQMVKKFSAVY
jgi:hypothetical protein